VPRIEVLDTDITVEQQRVLDEAAVGLRGRVPAPLRVWVKSPELARRTQRVGEFVRYQTRLPARLSELAILVTARHWTSQYEWYVHAEHARRAGLDPAAIEAIAARREPHLPLEDERLVYAFARQLHERRGIADDLYRASVACLGEQAVVELVMLLGYYTLVSMTLNTFEIGLPDDVAPPLPS
jgi:4-carboxymuconolactone decarboxylase